MVRKKLEKEPISSVGHKEGGGGGWEGGGGGGGWVLFKGCQVTIVYVEETWGPILKHLAGKEVHG